ncbi:uncharacterized protein BT62DRAFT_1008704 [Guyanagaster necrorhizus]|uniref:Uncharacterized protein n=1 Tax=Guyanagaster necrorhizus TaxID=856835 RepID=A0A9P7VPC0_9AGAR|nr:uncharacterized protein BT62DRAFT_1008704 [Guyanagaster necrorhizus MCA 3950]KAG7444015.1 hypothetical protein BT62DRAFT_1008704 [Guyanagaster necrorhizus MCA 3950]
MACDVQCFTLRLPSLLTPKIRLGPGSKFLIAMGELASLEASIVTALRLGDLELPKGIQNSYANFVAVQIVTAIAPSKGGLSKRSQFSHELLKREKIVTVEKRLLEYDSTSGFFLSDDSSEVQKCADSLAFTRSGARIYVWPSSYHPQATCQPSWAIVTLLGVRFTSFRAKYKAMIHRLYITLPGPSMMTSLLDFRIVFRSVRIESTSIREKGHDQNTSVVDNRNKNVGDEPRNTRRCKNGNMSTITSYADDYDLLRSAH